MPRADKETLTKHTVLLFKGDYEKLRFAYPEFGGAVILRRILRAHLEKIDPPIDTSSIKGDFP